MLLGGFSWSLTSLSSSDDETFDVDLDDWLSEWDQSFLSESFDFSLSLLIHFLPFASLAIRGDWILPTVFDFFFITSWVLSIRLANEFLSLFLSTAKELCLPALWFHICLCFLSGKSVWPADLFLNRSLLVLDCYFYFNNLSFLLVLGSLKLF